jgi:putative tryptophan/tyrosine transport system substrate-binding protein
MNNKFCSRFYESRLSPNLKSKIENLKWLRLSVIACVFVVAAGVAEAQQPAKLPRIGYVDLGANPNDPGPKVEGFRQGLRGLGYIEGKNILTEYRFLDGNRDRIPSVVAEFVQLKVDVIVVDAPPVVRALKQATKTIPIVIVTTQDPVAAGYVTSLARPGGNITGVTRLSRELSGKRLELLKEVVPGMSRVGLLLVVGPDVPGNALKEYEPAARALKIQLISIKINARDPDLEGAFREAVREHVSAVIMPSNSVLTPHLKKITDLATKNRLASMHERNSDVEAGGLMSYGTDDAESFRRAAVYVDKILKGTKPADLPVEQPTKFEFVINLKTAKQIGLIIPPNVLARADRVIK